MIPEDLKNAKLSPVTAGYLGIYLKLSDLLGEVSDVTELIYLTNDVDKVNEGFNNAIYVAMEEIMKLATQSIEENLGSLDNNVEI